MKLNLRTVGKIALATVRIGGPIATGVLGVVAGVKYDEAKKDKLYSVEDSEVKVEYGELDKKEKFKILAPIFAPVVISAGVTVACSLVDKHLDVKSLKQMTALYSASVLSATAYREKLVEVDPEAANEVAQEIEEKKKDIPNLPWNEEIEESTNGGDMLFVDYLSGRRFYSTFDAVEKALVECEKEYESPEYTYHMNKNAIDVYGCWPTRRLELNKLYEKLGLEQTWLGRKLGFLGVYDKDNENWRYNGEQISFHIEDGPDGIHYIMYDDMPMEGWWEE